MTSCASVSELRRKRHSYGKSPVSHIIVRMSRPRNKRLWPAPAKETMTPTCSCRSPVGPKTLMGASLTCGIDATPVLLRPCSLIAPRAALYLPPLQSIRAASALSAVVGVSASARLRGSRAVAQFFQQSAELRRSTHESFPGFAAVRAQARFPRRSFVCGCIVRFVVRSGPECCCPYILEMSSLICSSSHIRSRSFSSTFLSVPSGTFARSKRQR